MSKVGIVGFDVEDGRHAGYVKAKERAAEGGEDADEPDVADDALAQCTMRGMVVCTDEMLGGWNRAQVLQVRVNREDLAQHGVDRC